MENQGKRIYVLDARPAYTIDNQLILYEAWATHWRDKKTALILRRGGSIYLGDTCVLDLPLLIVGQDITHKNARNSRTVFEWQKGTKRGAVCTIDLVGGKGFFYETKGGKIRGYEMRPFAIPLSCSLVAEGTQIIHIPGKWPMVKGMVNPLHDTKLTKSSARAFLAAYGGHKIIVPNRKPDLDFPLEEGDAITAESILETATTKFVFYEGGLESYDPPQLEAARSMIFHLLAHEVGITQFTSSNLRRAMSSELIITTAQILRCQTDWQMSMIREPPNIFCRSDDGLQYSWIEILPKQALTTQMVDKIANQDLDIDVYVLARRYLKALESLPESSHIDHRIKRGKSIANIQHMLIESTQTDGSRRRIWIDRDDLDHDVNQKEMPIIYGRTRQLEFVCFDEKLGLVVNHATNF